MKFTGTVLNASREERDMVGKDGAKRHAVIFHVLLTVKAQDDDGSEIANIRAYDPDWTLPKVGSSWTSPRVKRYECFDGMVAEVGV